MRTRGTALQYVLHHVSQVSLAATNGVDVPLDTSTLYRRAGRTKHTFNTLVSWFDVLKIMNPDAHLTPRNRASKPKCNV